MKIKVVIEADPELSREETFLDKPVQVEVALVIMKLEQVKMKLLALSNSSSTTYTSKNSLGNIDPELFKK